MKLSNILAVGLVAFGLISTAMAVPVKIYITGSTAYRTATLAGINSSLTGALTTASNATGTNIGTSGNGNGNNTAFTITGGSFGGNPVTIKCSFVGSTAGIYNTSTSNTIPFLKDGATGTTNPDPYYAGTADNPELHTADITMGDTYQSTTPYSDGGVNFADLTDYLIGTVTFNWVASNGFPAGKQMSTEIANALMTSGQVPLSYFTGLAADANNTVFATGRNPGSGTRLCMLVDMKIGADTLVKQYKPTLSGTTVTSHQLYPIEVLDGNSTIAIGNSGEDTGAILRGFLNKTLSNGLTGAYSPTTTSYYMTYLGTGDANTTTSAGTLPAVRLGFNGVNYDTTSFLPVLNGSYPYWNVEHVMVGPDASGTAISFATSPTGLVAKLKATASGGSGTKLSDMQVHRSGDGTNMLTGVFP